MAGWAPDYITVEEARDFRRGLADVDDDELADAITAASRAIDEHCNRQFGVLAAAAPFAYTAWPDFDRGKFVVDIDDLMTSTSLVVAVGGTVTTAYTLGPVNAQAKGEPWTYMVFDSSAGVTGDEGEIVVTAKFGWTAVPTAVKHACKLQVSRLDARRDSPFGVAGSPQTGSELRLLSKVDPDVPVDLARYVRKRSPR